MKTAIESRRPEGVLDYIALAVTTFGVGYLPLMPGTFGSAVGVAIYLGISRLDVMWEHHWAPLHALLRRKAQAVSIAVFLIFFLLFVLLGIWACGPLE
jgi:phosphatidylglycerophosphatase A